MKKIFGLLLLLGLFISQGFYTISFATGEDSSMKTITPKTKSLPTTVPPTAAEVRNAINNTKNTTDTDTQTQNTVQGIRMNETCMLNGQCGFNIYQFLGIRKDIADNNSPELFVQDILLSATFFIGTVVTIGIIVSGLMFIFAGATGKDPSKAKAGLKNSFIGLLIVVCSYSIIRVVQYIAKGL